VTDPDGPVPWPQRPPEHPPQHPPVAPPTAPGAWPPPGRSASPFGPWVPDATGPRQPEVRWGLGDVLYGLLLWIAGGIAGTVVLILAGGVDLETGETGELSVPLLAVALVSGWIGLAGWPIVASYTKGRKSLAEDFGLKVVPSDVGWGVLTGIGCLAISIVGNVVWTLISSDEAPDNAGFLPDDPGPLGVIVVVLLVAVATPVIEELFFRGLFLRAAEKRWSPAVAVVVSSVVFGVFHFTGDSLAEGLFIVGVTAAYGTVLAVLAVSTRRLGAPIVAHMVINGIGVTAAFLT
jgi:uncharacterized protein